MKTRIWLRAGRETRSLALSAPLVWTIVAALFLAVACGSSTETPAGGGDGDGSGLPGDALVGGGDGGGGGSGETTGGDDDAGAPDTVAGDASAACADGARRCGPLGVVEECSAGAWSPRETCSTGRVCRDGECVQATGGECTPGEVRGCANQTAREVCNDEGLGYEPRPCGEGLYCVQGECGEELCAPGSKKCQDLDTFLFCATNGQAWGNPTPCPEGTVCTDGSCSSGCEAAIKLSSYIGCEYWTLDLDNYPDPFSNPKPNEVPHSVVISNPSHAPAIIRFDTQSGVDIPIDDPTVMPGQAKAFTMPRLDIDGSGITYNSIRIRSSMPVNAYQFNPLNNEAVYSNDGSLLLPANTLGRRYIVASYGSGPSLDLIGLPAQSGYITILATDPGTTQVTVQVTGDVVEGPDVPALSAGDVHVFELEQYQVLNLQAAPAEIFAMKMHDLTGSLVESTKPVAVFGGHEELVLGWKEDITPATNPNQQGTGSCCADHVEEQMIPVQVWTTDVLCAKAPLRGAPGNEKDIWRVFSGADGTQITTDPPIEGLDGVTLNYGEWVEVLAEASFEVHGTGKVMAVQYVVSQEQTDQGVGDPAMILSVPVGQYRDDYRILVPDGYNTDWVVVIRPAGEQVLVDELPTAVPFDPFGSGQWEVGYVQLQPGVHRVQANHAFGLIAFGWDSAVSYGYPAGLNLRAEDWTPTQ